MHQLIETIPETEELVINWHITEACNFRCRYCFASWEKAVGGKELWRSEDSFHRLLEALHGLFSLCSSDDPLRGGLRWRSLRLSLAGGEPTLLDGRLVDVVAYARTLGFNVSLITNGSRPDVIDGVARYIDMLGLSVDSLGELTNEAIGRACSKGSRVSADGAVAIVRRARSHRPGVSIKINTVVSAANAGEDLSELILRTHPDRWKVMRMLPTVTDALSVNADAFRSFVDRHRAFQSLMTVEDNTDMAKSYIMIDPYGRFFQNEPGLHGYRYSRPIPEVGAGAAFREVAFSPAGFASRYRKDQITSGTP